MRDSSLTLIVPSFNSARYLSDLVNSVFGGMTSIGEMNPQSFLPDQVIIVDDCSEDNTEEVVFDLSQLHNEIEYVKLSKNCGTAIACNEAIKRSSGTFITRIDADDMREFWSFENMMKAQLEQPDSYIYDDVMIFLNGQRKGKVWVMSDYNFHSLLERNSNHAGIMFPKRAWESCGGYPEEFSDGRDDWAFNVALGTVGCCGIHIGGAGYLYRREQQNRTVKNASSEHQKMYYQKMRSHFKEIYDGRFTMACCGNRGSSKVASATTRTPQPVVGSAGMTLLQYEGSNYGKETYFGPVTGVAYIFSKGSPIRNVDNRDLHTPKFKGLLDLNDHGKPVFSIFRPLTEPAKPVEEIPVPVQVVESQEIIQSGTEESSDENSPIESGIIKGLGSKEIDKLKESGITTWGRFFYEDSVKLSDILGKSVSVIEKMKDELTS